MGKRTCHAFFAAIVPGPVQQFIPHAAMQQPAAQLGEVGVDDLAQLLVGEVDPILATLQDQPLCKQLFQRAERLVIAASAGRGNCVQIKGSADHRSGSQHLLRNGCQRRQPRVEKIAHPARRGPRGVGQRKLSVRQQVQILRDEERQPVGFRIEPLRQLCPVDLARRIEQLDPPGDGCGWQSPEFDHGCSPLACAIGYQLAESMAGGYIFGAPAQEDTDRLCTQAAHEVGEPVQGRAVGAVEIVDQQQARPITRKEGNHRVGQPVEETALSGEGIGWLVSGVGGSNCSKLGCSRAISTNQALSSAARRWRWSGSEFFCPADRTPTSRRAETPAS